MFLLPTRWAKILLMQDLLEPESTLVATSEPLAVSRAEAARRLGVSVSTLKKLLGDREVESFCVGRRRLIPTSTLGRYVEVRLAAEREECG